MSVPFNVVQKPELGVPGGGVKKWYASVIISGDLSLREFRIRELV